MLPQLKVNVFQPGFIAFTILDEQTSGTKLNWSTKQL